MIYAILKAKEANFQLYRALGRLLSDDLIFCSSIMLFSLRLPFHLLFYLQFCAGNNKVLFNKNSNDL